ncbi:cell wall hydrolase [Paracoccus sp. 11-3]|uniref:Cell wall hydrolase n=1 Tax=Paracoccus amoyensis TaxID=2760093 RepID=A0A926GDA3_9RHOB|nr:cell wall hydrolase [Paracoccus amoyensis]MBC9247020.1 cell wall hydrolase [Paracoccus amoyensis]
MKTLLKRFAPVCLCATAALTFASAAANAGGNGSLFSSDAGIFGAASNAMELPRPKPLLYTDAEPVKVENLVIDEDYDAPDAKLFLASTRTQFSEQDLNCLSEAVYHEARGESSQGQAAVAEVILNRVDSRAFPRTVCGVVNQPSQFSYTIGGPKPIRNKAAYMRARNIAENALAGAPRVLTGGATYFHTPAVRPAWSHRFQRTARIGQHIFYRRGGQRVASN